MKYPLKELPKCYGDPEPECIKTCALEPACSDFLLEAIFRRTLKLYLFLHNKDDPERKTNELRRLLEKHQKAKMAKMAKTLKKNLNCENFPSKCVWTGKGKTKRRHCEKCGSYRPREEQP